MKSNNRIIYFILLFGAILRYVFYEWLGPIYYNKLNYFEQADSSGWLRSIAYLVKTGTYTYEPGVVNGEFFRPPGYSFFMLPFYLFSGMDAQKTYASMVVVQCILDVLAIWFVYKIAQKFFEKENYALFTALIYACYPFIIVWTPIVQAESMSVFFLLGGFYFLLNTQIKWNYVWSGLFIAAMVLTRVQAMFIIFGFAAGFLYAWKRNLIPLKNIVVFFAAFTALYGLWPARNYFLHDRLVLGMDMRIGRNWAPDFVSFMRYIYSVKTDHQPQYSQIVFNKEVKWPEASYKFEGDSALLDSVVKLSRTCGTGFSKFMFHEKVRSSWIQDNNNCDTVIANIFNTLADKQYSQNKMNAWVITPLNNLKKAVFKIELMGDKSGLIKTAASGLFIYRSLMLLLGIAGLVIGWKRKDASSLFIIVASVFTIVWYGYISFIYRNMEIRYLLQCDILLLFPATYLLYLLYEKRFGSKVNLK